MSYVACNLGYNASAPSASDVTYNYSHVPRWSSLQLVAPRCLCWSVCLRLYGRCWYYDIWP
jgi:hypothetical protein